MDENNEQLDENTDEKNDAIEAEIAKAIGDAHDQPFNGWWAIAAAIVVVIGFLGWSELRLRNVRLELETISSQMSALDNQNQSLQYQYDSARLRLETIRSATHTFQLNSPDETGSGSATVYLNGENRRAVVVFEELQPNDRNAERYHLWLSVSDSEEQSLTSVFDIGETGKAELMMQHLPDEEAISSISVTLEPVGDVEAPNEVVVLLGAP